jgi:hypothetical protein
MGKNIILITIDQVISYATCQSIIGCNMNLHLTFVSNGFYQSVGDRGHFGQITYSISTLKILLILQESI